MTTLRAPPHGYAAGKDRLPEGGLAAAEFLPERAGEYEFTRGMVMLRGKAVVE